jgi:hypothetical protein
MARPECDTPLVLLGDHSSFELKVHFSLSNSPKLTKCRSIFRLRTKTLEARNIHLHRKRSRKLKRKQLHEITSKWVVRNVQVKKGPDKIGGKKKGKDMLGEITTKGPLETRS